MRTLRFLLVLLAMSGCATSSPTERFSDDVEFEDSTSVTDLPASDQVLRAEAALVAGHLRDAHALLDAAVTTTPNDPRALFDLALVLELGDDLEGAERRYRAATRLLPEDPMQHANLGFALLRSEGHQADACVSLLRAKRLAAGDAELLREIGAGLRAAGDAAEALRVFEALIADAEEGAPLAELHVEAALSAAAAEQGDAAERHAREAIRIAPTHAGALVLLGRLARARNDVAAARTAYEAAARAAEPGSSLAREATEALRDLPRR